MTPFDQLVALIDNWDGRNRRDLVDRIDAQFKLVRRSGDARNPHMPEPSDHEDGQTYPDPPYLLLAERGIETVYTKVDRS